MARQYGTGSIVERGGKFRARVSIQGTKRYLGTFLTREDAEAAVAEVLEVLGAHPGAQIGETLRSWSYTWLEDRANDGHHNDVKNDGYASRRWQNATIGQLALSSVTTRDVRNWLDAQVRTKSEAQTIRNSLNLLRQCLEYACHRGKIDANPSVGVRLPKIHRKKRADPWTWLTEPELAAVAANEDGGYTEEGDAILVAAYTGMRAGEQFGMRRTDVELANGTLAVRSSWAHKRTTKSRKARRVQILEPARAALERQLARHKGLYVWPRADGKPRGKADIPDLTPRLQRARILRAVRWHDLRHTCASHLVQGTWAPRYIARPLRLEEIATWLGHGQATTSARYAHLSPEALGGLVVRTPKRKEPEDE